MDDTMTTSTERLRKLLDERGVEWYEPPTKPNKTWFPDENGINCSASPWSDTLEIKRHGLTPEQAIAATLGSDDRYDAGFASGVQAVFQQLEGIEDYEGLQDLIAEYWGEGEGNDEL